MATRKYLYPSLGFGAGMVFGILILGLMSFNSPPGGTGISPVSVEIARGYISKYVSGATRSNEIIKGFTIDKTQVDAMNALLRENPALTGFRIYLGKTADNIAKGIVVGVDAEGKDAVNNTIYGTDSKSVSPCPPACETTSPLIAQ